METVFTNMMGNTGTSDLPRRKSLGKRLSSWQKKSTSQNIAFDANLTISAETPGFQGERSTVVKTNKKGNGTRLEFGGLAWGEKWAKIWMRKLRRKKKCHGEISTDRETPEPRIKILTLAEQLQMAQAGDFCLEECQVQPPLGNAL